MSSELQHPPLVWPAKLVLAISEAHEEQAEEEEDEDKGWQLRLEERCEKIEHEVGVLHESAERASGQLEDMSGLLRGLVRGSNPGSTVVGRFAVA